MTAAPSRTRTCLASSHRCAMRRLRRAATCRHMSSRRSSPISSPVMADSGTPSTYSSTSNMAPSTSVSATPSTVGTRAPAVPARLSASAAFSATRRAEPAGRWSPRPLTRSARHQRSNRSVSRSSRPSTRTYAPPSGSSARTVGEPRSRESGVIDRASRPHRSRTDRTRSVSMRCGGAPSSTRAREPATTAEGEARGQVDGHLGRGEQAQQRGRTDSHIGHAPPRAPQEGPGGDGHRGGHRQVGPGREGPAGEPRVELLVALDSDGSGVLDEGHARAVRGPRRGPQPAPGGRAPPTCGG